MNKTLKRILISLLTMLIIGLIIIFGINLYVKSSTKQSIMSINDLNKDYDAILVLGAGLRNGKPSPVLKDRLDTAYEVYENGASNKIIVSGDHGTKTYDEVNVMKDYLTNKGVPSEDIFMDHAGFSTYDSVYRAKEIFKAQKIIIVTQKYHLHRALYVAEELGIEAYGVASDPREYRGQVLRELREVLARDKDFFKCIIKPEPTYLGDTIPVSGNGDATNDKKGDF